MRVLFYVEPHPIRDTLIHFKDIARDFLPLLSTGPKLDTRLFANSATLDEIKVNLAPYQKRLIRPTPEDEAVFAQYARPWTSDGIPAWLDLMAGVGQVTDDYEQVLERIWRRFPFDVIIHWGENGAITRFIGDRTITRIAMELGCTRPPFLDSIVMDPYGTNGAGMVPRLSITDLRDIVGGKTMSRHEALLAYSENLEARPYEQQFQPLRGDLLARTAGVEKLAFLPLQLFDDANLLRFSPYATLSDVVLDVVPKLAAAGYTTIITPHPASKHRPHGAFSTAAAKAELRPWAGQVIWLDPGEERPPNAQLIALSDVVVTVNSSVGFEATYFDKPVVVLGEAIYKPKGLFPTLEGFLAGNFDHAAYMEGIGWLRRFFLGGYLQGKNIRSDVSSFEHRIGQLDWLWRHHRNNPVAVARGFWQVTSPSHQTYAESAAFAGQSVAGQQEFIQPVVPAMPAVSRPETGNLKNICWQPVARCLVTYSQAANIEQFTSWLDEKLSTIEGLTDVVTAGEIVVSQEYLELHEDVERADVDPLVHFVHRGLIEQRKPRKRLPGVTQDQFRNDLLSAASDVLSPNAKSALTQYPLDTEDSTRRTESLARIRDGLTSSTRRIAVVAHLYYRDLVPEILDRLRAIPEEFDLIVTLPDWGSRRIEEMVRQTHPNALFYHAANRGRDIGPFIDLLPMLIDKGHEAVLKIQTKRGYYLAGRLRPELGDLWREESFDALLGNPGRVGAILRAFRADPDLAMIGPEPHYLGLADYPYHDGGALAQAVLDKAPEEGFFAGTMFWVRPAALRPLVDSLALSITSFAAETGANDGALAHLVERLFGHAATAAGGVIGASTDPSVPLVDPLLPLAVKMHERIEQALKDKRAGAKVKGALAW